MLTLKMLVDKEKKRVVFAESDKDFVDILFSFLTLPMGTIIRLLDKKTSLGCLDKLYESVEELDEGHFRTEACKTMLLHPLNASRCQLEDLILKIDGSKVRKFYTCRKPECCIKSCFYSSVPKARCSCGEIMDLEFEWAKKGLKGSDKDEVFVKGIGNFIISDDLHIMPASTTVILDLLDKLGIKDESSLEEMTMDLGAEMVLNLLRRSLHSKSPLSGICFQSADMSYEAKSSWNVKTEPKLEEDSAAGSKELKAKVFVCKSSNKVVYAETLSGEGLIDLIFSFLTFPLGSVVKLLDKYSSIGCVDNLRRSVENLSSDCMKSDECKSMLLAPKLAPYFGCSISLLASIEMLPGSGNFTGCSICFRNRMQTVGSDACYYHGVKHVKFYEMNPKQPASKELGGGYAKEAIKFMITDELQVTPFSALSIIQTTKKLKVPATSLVEREISIGETEALNLMKSCLTSQSSLSNVFLPKKKVK